MCFLLLSSPSPSMVNGGMKKLLVQQSSARPLPINIYCQLLQELSHISPPARSRCISELLLHVAGTVGSVLFTVQTCVAVCCTLLNKNKLTCMTSPSCTFACSPRLDPDSPCPWRSLLSSSQRLSSAGSVTTGSRYHQEVLWTVAKGYSIREGF